MLQLYTIWSRTKLGYISVIVIFRNTILVADSVTNIGVEEALNSYLTGVTWGHLDSQKRWVWDSDIPTIR